MFYFIFYQNNCTHNDVCKYGNEVIVIVEQCGYVLKKSRKGLLLHWGRGNEADAREA